MYALELANAMLFLSTLSLRRATFDKSKKSKMEKYFYPRSPCGERPGRVQLQTPAFYISIHALLAESDTRRAACLRGMRNFYPRSPCGERLYTDLNSAYGALISIHALLAESDQCKL